MPTHKEAYEAYNTLARYVAYKCFPKSGSCKKCPFLRFDGFTCLVQRMGVYPQLSIDTDAKASILQNLERLKSEEKPKEWAGDAYIVKPEDC